MEPVDLFGLASSPASGEAAASGEADASLAAERSPERLDAGGGSGMFHRVSMDMRTVRYVAVSRHIYDVGAVQADAPAPAGRTAYYFEMTVRDAGQQGRVAIGFTPAGYNLCCQPGWERNSCGYHGDDGCIYREKGSGEPFGPTFTSGDTVGAGINYASQQFFFTKNGKLVGKVCKDIQGPLYPTVAVHSQNEEVTVNFGMEPFLFDIEDLILDESSKKQAAMEKLSLPPNVCHRIVRSYLLHYGYRDTLRSFDAENAHNPIHSTEENGNGQPGDSYALNLRKILRQLIKKGDVDSVFHKLQEWYPQVLQSDTSPLCFLLHSQRFIEYIRAAQLAEAVNYARAELAKFSKFKSYRDFLEETFALVAYEEPDKSCIGYHLSESRQEFVADAVNAVVLSTNPDKKASSNCMSSCLEKLLRQMIVCLSVRRALNGNQGEAFSLQELLISGGKIHS